MEKIKKLFYIFILLLIAFIFFPGIFLTKESLLTCDHQEQHYPWAYLLSKKYKENSLPWWTHSIGCGFPLVAEGQCGAFYPLNYLFYKYLPFNTAYSLLFIFHFILSGIFAYLYFLRNKLKPTAAFFSTLLYMFSSLYAGAFYNYNSLKVLTYYPLCLLLLDIILEKNYWYLYGVIGILFSFQVLAGYLQFALYSIFVCFLYLVLRGILFRFSIRNFIFHLIGLAISCGIAIIFSSVQLLHTYTLTQLSTRANVGEEFAYIGSFSPMGFLNFWFPYISRFTLYSCYIGIIPLFFICASFIIKKKNENILLHIFLFTICILLAMGKYFPLYLILIKTTKLYSLRIPYKFIYFSLFSGIFLAGVGFQNIFDEGVKERKFAIRASNIFFWITGFVILITLLLALIVRWGYQALYNIGIEIIKSSILNKPGHPYSFDYYQQKLKNYLEGLNHLINITNPWFIYGIISLIASTLMVFIIRKRPRKGIFYTLTIIITLIDLFIYKDLFIKGDISSYEKISQENAVVKFLKKDKSLYRVLNFKGHIPEGFINSSYNLLFNIDVMGIYSPLVLKRYYELFWDLGNIDDSTGFAIANITQLKDYQSLLRCINVKYILSDEPISYPNFKLIKKLPPKIFVYLNTGYLPRIYTVENFLYMKNKNKILKYLCSKDFIPEKVIVLEVSPKINLKNFPLTYNVKKEYVKILKYSDMEIKIKTSLKKWKFLFLSCVYYPGWTAFIDGKEVKIYRANYCFQSIIVPAGYHKIIFRYYPNSIPAQYFSKFINQIGM